MTESTKKLPKPKQEIVRIVSPEAFAQARRFVDVYHSYIKWADRPSRKLYWLLYEEGRLVGVWGLGSAFSRPKPVQNYMAEHSLKFNEVANNIVYALAGCEDRNAGTRFLAQLRRDAAERWAEKYGDQLRAFQTFILPPRTGALYKADNWTQLGSTSGGVTQATRTVAPKTPGARPQVFRNGTVRWLLRTYVKTAPKLIFMRLVK